MKDRPWRRLAMRANTDRQRLAAALAVTMIGNPALMF
jgi:hypothetical protein